MKVICIPGLDKVLAQSLSCSRGAIEVWGGELVLGQSALFLPATYGQFPAPCSPCFPPETRRGFLMSHLNAVAQSRLLGQAENLVVWRCKILVPRPALPHSSLPVALAVTAAICSSTK